MVGETLAIGGWIEFGRFLDEEDQPEFNLGTLN
jgi:hypothetical protein